MRTWSREMGSALFAARVATVALGVLGLLGAMLAVTGIFGMASYTVSKRLRELGIRMALGARRKQVLRAALGRAFVLLSVGSLTGIALGVLASKVLSYIVYQAAPRDPVVLGGGGADDAGAGVGSCVDSSAKGARGQSHDPYAGGVNWANYTSERRDREGLRLPLPCIPPGTDANGRRSRRRAAIGRAAERCAQPHRNR
jgi:hypothetical protein